MKQATANNSTEQQFPYFIPKSDILKDENEYKIILDVPGIKKENIDIKVKENLITIKGKYETKDDYKAVYREFNYGHFQRSFQIDKAIDSENISAKHENGILTLTLPLHPEQSPKKITIN